MIVIAYHNACLTIIIMVFWDAKNKYTAVANSDATIIVIGDIKCGDTIQ